MARLQDVIDAIIFSLKDSGELPEEATFIGFEPDNDTQPIKLPIIQVDPEGEITDANLANTQFVGFSKDDDGNNVGRIFERLSEIPIRLSVLTAQGSKFDEREISDTARTVLFKHETAGPFEPLKKEDGTTLDEVWRFDIDESTQTDNLGTSPPLRRFVQRITVGSSEQFVTTADEPPLEKTEVEVEEK
jgi:PAS domain-containing protein